MDGVYYEILLKSICPPITRSRFDIIININMTTKNSKRWKLIKSKPLLQTKWISILKNDYELPDGKVVEGYYQLERPNYVLIVSIDSKKRLVVERNYRRGVNDFVYELPAGWVDKEESPKEAAERELKEET